jgi:hypothetical protein
MATGGHRVDFVVSYAAEDDSWAQWIAWLLEDVGYRVNVRAWDVVPGNNLIIEMRRSAELAARTVAVLSEEYLASAYREAEWQAAWREDPNGQKRQLLVFRITDCLLPALLADLVTVDLFDVDQDAARGRVLAAARGDREKPERQPVYPGSRPRSATQATPATADDVSGTSIATTQPAGYLFDVFVSYNESNLWPEWVGAHFRPMLEHFLSTALGRRASLFCTTNGIRSDRERREAYLSSRVMVSLWSREYFSGDCVQELAHMLARSRWSRTHGLFQQLVLGATIHGEKQLPPSVADLQRVDVSAYANPWLPRGSASVAELSEMIKSFADDVANAVENAPAWDPQWLTLESGGFASQIRRENAGQRSVPSLGARRR